MLSCVYTSIGRLVHKRRARRAEPWYVYDYSFNCRENRSAGFPCDHLALHDFRQFPLDYYGGGRWLESSFGCGVSYDWWLRRLLDRTLIEAVRQVWPRYRRKRLAVSLPSWGYPWERLSLDEGSFEPGESKGRCHQLTPLYLREPLYAVLHQVERFSFFILYQLIATQLVKGGRRRGRGWWRCRGGGGSKEWRRQSAGR